jgi:hypothetical protein
MAAISNVNETALDAILLLLPRDKVSESLALLL